MDEEQLINNLLQQRIAANIGKAFRRRMIDREIATLERTRDSEARQETEEVIIQSLNEYNNRIHILEEERISLSPPAFVVVNPDGQEAYAVKSTHL